jgi:hypothetical protein
MAIFPKRRSNIGKTNGLGPNGRVIEVLDGRLNEQYFHTILTGFSKSGIFHFSSSFHFRARSGNPLF